MMTGFGMKALVVRDERSGISQSAVGAGPSGGFAKGCCSTTWLLGGLDVETRPSLRTFVQHASTAFCETTPFLGEAAFGLPRQRFARHFFRTV